MKNMKIDLTIVNDMDGVYTLIKEMDYAWLYMEILWTFLLK